MHVSFERIMGTERTGYAARPSDLMNHVPTPEEQAKAVRDAQNVCEIIQFPYLRPVLAEPPKHVGTDWWGVVLLLVMSLSTAVFACLVWLAVSWGH